MPDVQTVLLHLSDIHFRRNRSGTAYDLDTDLRIQLERDAVEMGKRLGVIHGIVISGDVAFSGNKDEYVIAGEWLVRVCFLLGCDTQNVWTVPGNHDIDRTVIDNSNQLQLLHRELRARPAATLDERLRQYLFEDKEAGAMLFRPLRQYNSFALQFQCEVSEERPAWEYNLILNDGSTLRLHGATSTIVSDATDDRSVAPLVVGEAQSLLIQQDGVEYLFICHHPPDWLLDHDVIEDRLRARARIQMFGHKHAARGFQVGNNLRLSAGAAHPDRGEPGWEPTFNVLSISVRTQDGNRTMELDVYPRVWNKKDLCFRGELSADKTENHHFSFSLPRWTPPDKQVDPTMIIENATTVDRAAETSVLELSEARLGGGRLVNPARRLTYRFMSLPYQVRIEVAQKLDLIENDDSDLEDTQRYESYFRRAKERKLLSKLWEEVERAHGAELTNNPFVGQ